MLQQPNQHDQKKEEMNQPTTPQTWRERFREKYESFELCDTVSKTDFDRLNQFIQQTIEQEVKKEREKTKRAYCEICRCFIDADTGEREDYA